MINLESAYITGISLATLHTTSSLKLFTTKSQASSKAETTQ